MKSLAEIESQQKEQMKKLIEWVGSQTRLANELGVSPQVVSAWVSRGRISATMAVKVEQKTNGLFKKEEMRPDVVSWEK